jgi:hypothetical protein
MRPIAETVRKNPLYIFRASLSRQSLILIREGIFFFINSPENLDTLKGPFDIQKSLIANHFDISGYGLMNIKIKHDAPNPIWLNPQTFTNFDGQIISPNYRCSHFLSSSPKQMLYQITAIPVTTQQPDSHRAFVQRPNERRLVLVFPSQPFLTPALKQLDAALPMEEHDPGLQLEGDMVKLPDGLQPFACPDMPKDIAALIGARCNGQVPMVQHLKAFRDVTPDPGIGIEI